MKFNLNDELSELYERWLLENYPESFSCKDQFIELVLIQYQYDEFINEVNLVDEFMSLGRLKWSKVLQSELGGS